MVAASSFVVSLLTNISVGAIGIVFFTLARKRFRWLYAPKAVHREKQK